MCAGTVKACVFCKHCDYEEFYAYSTITSGGGTADCRKGKFSIRTAQQLMEGDIYELALQCEHFELRDDLKKLGGGSNG